MKECLNLIIGNVTWQQPLDYEGLLFRCHQCQKVGHLAQKCPIAAYTVTTCKRRYHRDTDPQDKGNKDPTTSTRSFDTIMLQHPPKEQTELRTARSAQHLTGMSFVVSRKEQLNNLIINDVPSTNNYTSMTIHPPPT